MPTRYYKVTCPERYDKNRFFRAIGSIILGDEDGSIGPIGKQLDIRDGDQRVWYLSYDPTPPSGSPYGGEAEDSLIKIFEGSLSDEGLEWVLFDLPEILRQV